MAKNVPKRKHILRNILLVIAAIPVLFILYIIATLLLSPVFDSTDKARFEKLDTQSRELYAQVQAASAGAETWVYNASCEEVKSGPWPTGEFSCKTEIVSKIPAATTGELLRLHGNYYAIIDGSTMLKQTSVLDMQLPGDFGVNFVVSSAEKNYKFSDDSSIKCAYISKLAQSNLDANTAYGSVITGGVGTVYIGIECSDKARGDWYKT